MSKDKLNLNNDTRLINSYCIFPRIIKGDFYWFKKIKIKQKRTLQLAYCAHTFDNLEYKEVWVDHSVYNEKKEKDIKDILADTITQGFKYSLRLEEEKERLFKMIKDSNKSIDSLLEVYEKKSYRKGTISEEIFLMEKINKETIIQKDLSKELLILLKKNKK